MPTDTRLNLTPQFVMGVCLVLFGALLTLDRLQVIDADVSFRFWPVALVALGGWIVFDRRETGWSVPGIVMIGAGALLLLNSFDIVRVRVWELFWPIIIVLIGTRLIMHTPGRTGDRNRFRQIQDTLVGGGTPPIGGAVGTINMFSVLGGSKRASNDKPFRGGEITALLGGTHLDLRQATIEPGEQAVINVFAMMGGHEVWVPSGWTVGLDVMPILGNVEDKRLPALDPTPRPPNEAPPRLVLRGVVVMGGVTIRN